MAYMLMPVLPQAGLVMHRNTNSTSLAVTGTPSDQAAFSSRWMVKVRLSSVVMLSASWGTNSSSWFSSTRGRKVRDRAYLTTSSGPMSRGFMVVMVLVTATLTDLGCSSARDTLQRSSMAASRRDRTERKMCFMGTSFFHSNNGVIYGYSSAVLRPQAIASMAK